MSKPVANRPSPFTIAALVVALDNLKHGRDTFFLARLAEAFHGTVDTLLDAVRQLRDAPAKLIKITKSMVPQGLVNPRSAVWVGKCGGECGHVVAIRASALRDGDTWNLCRECLAKFEAEGKLLESVQRAIDADTNPMMVQPAGGEVAPIKVEEPAKQEELPAGIPAEIAEGKQKRPSRKRQPKQKSA